MESKTSGVAAVDRALSILSAFHEEDDALSLAELARRTNLYKSTILRLIVSLERAAFLRRLDDGRYRLGPALLQLGKLYQASFRLEDHVMPVLKRLVDETGESASFYVPEGDRRICLFRVNSRQHRVLHYVTPGTVLPIHTGASGKVLLAFGEPDNPAYAEVHQNLLVSSVANRKSDTAALACPVFGAGDVLSGSLSLAGPNTRFTKATVPAMRKALLSAATDLTGVLGGDSTLLREKLEQDTAMSDSGSGQQE